MYFTQSMINYRIRDTAKSRKLRDECSPHFKDIGTTKNKPQHFFLTSLPISKQFKRYIKIIYFQEINK